MGATTLPLRQAVLAAMAHKSAQTDDGDPLGHTPFGISHALKARGMEASSKEVEEIVAGLRSEGLAYKPFSYDLRFTLLSDAGMEAAAPCQLPPRWNGERQPPLL